MNNFLEVTYRISPSDADADEAAQAILLEQTVETPLSVAERYPFVREHMMGHIGEIVADDHGEHTVTLVLPTQTAASDPAQFLNVLFGNSSLRDDIRLDDFRISPSFEALFPGPRHGIGGLRQASGVVDRPLTCSALKPAGLQLGELAKLCRDFTAGGIDLIKDDHYLANQPFASFEERVQTCLDAVSDASAARGGQSTIYIPNLSGTPDTVRRQAEFAQEAGVKAVMIAPMLLGLPMLHELTTDVLDVPVLAHPSFGGAVRMRPATLFGKVFRLFGADAVIFANYGGRFSYSAEVCAGIADALRAEWMWIRSAFPVPAGGMDANRAAELVRFFGSDTILLVGGSLLEAGDDLTAKTTAFTERVATAAAALPSTG